MKLLTIAALAGLCLPATGMGEPAVSRAPAVSGANAAPIAPPAPSRFALVELFTSEGCSSCPPADALLARLAADAARSGEPIATLSFHVTYWDQLGWKDRFSDEAFTRRQGAYRRRFALASLYTPQMVVGG